MDKCEPYKKLKWVQAFTRGTFPMTSQKCAASLRAPTAGVWHSLCWKVGGALLGIPYYKITKIFWAQLQKSDIFGSLGNWTLDNS